VARRACSVKQDLARCEASLTMWSGKPLQNPWTASQRLAMATKRNHRLKRHRLEHPAMVGQGVVTGQPYSLGTGCVSDGQTSGTPNNPRVPVTSLATSQVLAYRWSLKQVADDTDMNLGTMHGFPSGIGVCDQCHAWGGVPVVVRDRESLSHGEGGQSSPNAIAESTMLEKVVNLR
jgi:hypothetical protein